MPNKNQLHTKVRLCVNDQKKMMKPLPIRKSIRNSRVELTPISKMLQRSSKKMDQDTKKIEPVIHHKEQSIIPSNLKISKEVTITSVTHVNNTENNIMLMLQKLPGITIDLIKPEPVFKVPESPKLKTNIITQNKLKVLFEKKGLSIRRDGSIEAKDNFLSHNIVNILNTNLNQSKTLTQKQKLNNISLITKSSDKEILNNPEVSFKIYPVSEKENVQRTSSPKKLLKKIQSSSKTKSKSFKTIKLAEEVSNNCKIFTKEVKPTEKVSNNNSNISSKEVKIISEKETFKNNIQLKTNERDKDNYKLMDLSTDGQINVVPAYFPLNFIDGNVPEYDNFLKGINKSSENRSHLLEASQNDTEIRSIINKSELGNCSDFLGCVNTSLNINESDDIYSKLAFQSFNNGNNLDNIKDKQLYKNNKSKENMIGKFNDEHNQNSNFYFYNHTSKQEQPSHQYYETNQMMDTSIKQEENQLSQNMTSYFCDNSIENMPKHENNLIDLNIPILPNNIKNSSNLNSDENCIKRKESPNDLSMCEKLKKQKIIHDMNQMMDTYIKQEDNKLLQNMTSYYCDNSMNNMPKNENNIMDFNKLIVSNNIKNSSNLNSDENETKRMQSQNELSLCEKLRTQKI